MKRGIRFETDLLKIFILKNNLGLNRVGIGCVREAWNKKTTLRNRARRIISEAYRREKPLLKSGFDVVLICKKINKKILTQHIEAEIKKIFERIERPSNLFDKTLS